MDRVRSKDVRSTEETVQRYLNDAGGSGSRVEERSHLAQLCAECILLFQAILTGLSAPQASESPERKKTVISLRRSHGRMKIWSDENGAADGGLDETLAVSKSLQRDTLKYIVSISQTLTEKLVDLLDIKISETGQESISVIKSLTAAVADGNSDNSSDSGLSNFSTESVKGILEDLRVDTTCLLDLEPLLRSPILRTDAEPIAVWATKHVKWSPHQPYSDKVSARFPQAGDDLVNRLGKANYERYLRCQEQKASNELARCPTDQTAPAVHDGASSKFHDSGIGSSLPTTTSSYAETVMSYGMGEGRKVRIPPLPSQAKAGLPFECVACGKSVKISTNSAWKQHVYADLRPWMCLETNCSIATFSTRNDWISHIALDHGMGPEWRTIECSLCRMEAGPGKPSITRHLSDHLEEVSLAALPVDCEFEEEPEPSEPDLDDEDQGLTIESAWSDGLSQFRGLKQRFGPFDLKMAVNSLGGYDQVSKSNEWSQVGLKLGFHVDEIADAASFLQRAYQTWVSPYDDDYLREPIGQQQQVPMLGTEPSQELKNTMTTGVSEQKVQLRRQARSIQDQPRLAQDQPIIARHNMKEDEFDDLDKSSPSISAEWWREISRLEQLTDGRYKYMPTQLQQPGDPQQVQQSHETGESEPQAESQQQQLAMQTQQQVSTLATKLFERDLGEWSASQQLTPETCPPEVLQEFKTQCLDTARQTVAQQQLVIQQQETIHGMPRGVDVGGANMEHPVNAFQIKRQAHAVSRSDAGFNPFGHIWNNKNRRQTWDGEAQRDLVNPEDEDVEGEVLHHSLPNNGEAVSASNKRHKCPYCDTEFTRHHNLQSHLLTHSQEKPYLCQTCNLRFRRLHDLKRHGRLHTSEGAKQQGKKGIADLEDPYPCNQGAPAVPNSPAGDKESTSSQAEVHTNKGSFDQALHDRAEGHFPEGALPTFSDPGLASSFVTLQDASTTEYQWDDIHSANQMQLPGPIFNEEQYLAFSEEELRKTQVAPHISPIGQGNAMLYTPHSLADVDDGFDDTPVDMNDARMAEDGQDSYAPSTGAPSSSQYGRPISSDPAAIYSFPPVMQTVGVPQQHDNQGHVRVAQSRPKPECWEHGCDGRLFSTFSNLLRHQREKSGQAIKACVCGAEFSSTRTLNRHLLHQKCKQKMKASTLPDDQVQSTLFDQQKDKKAIAEPRVYAQDVDEDGTTIDDAVAHATGGEALGDYQLQLMKTLEEHNKARAMANSRVHMEDADEDGNIIDDSRTHVSTASPSSKQAANVSRTRKRQSKDWMSSSPDHVGKMEEKGA
ncbi:hypothetical protein diail_6871 [Diaporthe ilicicola]|nr:hypothetical protein diail_6871 [Diaporthe ilicicola]